MFDYCKYRIEEAKLYSSYSRGKKSHLPGISGYTSVCLEKGEYPHDMEELLHSVVLEHELKVCRII